MRQEIEEGVTGVLIEQQTVCVITYTPMHVETTSQLHDHLNTNRPARQSLGGHGRYRRRHLRRVSPANTACQLSSLDGIGIVIHRWYERGGTNTSYTRGGA